MFIWSICPPQPESLAVETTIGNLIASLPERGPEVLIGMLDYGNRETGVVNSHNPLAAVWSKWDYYEHESDVRLLVDANNSDESHGPRCMCQETENRSIELNPNTFMRVYAHPTRGGNKANCRGVKGSNWYIFQGMILMDTEQRANRITELHNTIGINISQLEFSHPPSESRRILEQETARLISELKTLQAIYPL